MFKRPDGTVSSWVATIVETTKLQYIITAESDLDQQGNWIFQAYAVLGGKKAYGEKVKKVVKDKILTPG